jgi:uncharacterized membrane protein
MRARFVLFLKGFCMGIADVIPGVSGGTMALILGIYERVVGSIRNVSLGMIRALFTGAFWKRGVRLLLHPAEERADTTDRYAGSAAFLAVLVAGILVAALTGVRIIPRLMTEYRAPTLGFFMGLVMASVIVPYRMMDRRGWRELVAFGVAAVGTFFLVGLPIDQSANARGAVTIRATAPTAEPVRLAAADTKLSTARFGGDPKREIIFLPHVEEPVIVVPADGTPVTVPVVAQMGGVDGNVGDGEVRYLLEPKAAQAALTVEQQGPVTGGANPALWYIFLCGAVAICAMILPGISGSFILLLLGQYFYVVHTVHEIVYGRDLSRLPVLAVFLVGLVVGILSFSRVLHWLFSHFRAIVMAVLIGLMVGSLRVIWPFQELTVEGTRNQLPPAFDGTVAATLGTALLGITIVVTLEWLGARRPRAAA